MQQYEKKLYAAPRVKSVRFQVEQGYTCSQDDCLGQEMKSTLENYKLDTSTENLFGDVTSSTSGGSESSNF